MAADGVGFGPGQLMPGTKYRVVRELGAGGMGIVYQVEKPPQIQGVLKLMAPELASEEVFRRRFFDEVHVLAQLDHPNIVRVSDYDALSDGTPYYVMELLQGRTVRDVLATLGRVPPRAAFEITRQLCDALHCAHTHARSVVHRDIKPENIFLHAPRHGDPVVKLIDFGVVAIEGRAHDGTFVGTWRYAAPEQVRGERAIPATDLYAVGLVLYEMLAGAGPFDHIDTGQLISQAHLRDAPRPVSALAPWVPASVVELLDAALAKEPARRPRTAHAFAERLYELEWASDGHDAEDRVSEGPLRRVLSSVSAGAPPGAPELGARDGAPRRSPTKPWTSEADDGPPDEDALLAALVARPDVESRKRRAAPSGAPAPSPVARVVVQPSGRDPAVLELRSGRGTAETLERAPTSLPSDTFASQQSEARPTRMSRAAMPIVITIAIACVVATLALGAIVMQRRDAGSEGAPTRPSAETTAPTVEAATSTAGSVPSPATMTATSAEPAAAAPSNVRRPPKASAARSDAPTTPIATAAPTTTPAATAPPAATPTATAKKRTDDGYLRELR